MPIITLIVWMAVIGLIAWVVTTYIPMPPPIKSVIVIAAVIICVLILLQALGIGLYGPTVPRIY
jgi:hypothetical protein